MATYWKKFAAGIATASVLMLGACDLSAYPCRGPYGEPCGGPRSGWPGAVTCPNCEKFGGPTWSTCPPADPTRNGRRGRWARLGAE